MPYYCFPYKIYEFVGKEEKPAGSEEDSSLWIAVVRFISARPQASNPPTVSKQITFYSGQVGVVIECRPSNRTQPKEMVKFQ